jgi:hypothetical protein
MSSRSVVPIDYYELKYKIRNEGLNQTSRERLWPVLSQVIRQAEPKEYPDVLGSAERLLGMMPAGASLSIADCSSEQKHDMLFQSLTSMKGVECRLSVIFISRYYLLWNMNYFHSACASSFFSISLHLSICRFCVS